MKLFRTRNGISSVTTHLETTMKTADELRVIGIFEDGRDYAFHAYPQRWALFVREDGPLGLFPDPRYLVASEQNNYLDFFPEWALFQIVGNWLKANPK